MWEVSGAKEFAPGRAALAVRLGLLQTGLSQRGKRQKAAAELVRAEAWHLDHVVVEQVFADQLTPPQPLAGYGPVTARELRMLLAF
jgi:hypothetical protein